MLRVNYRQRLVVLAALFTAALCVHLLLPDELRQMIRASIRTGGWIRVPSLRSWPLLLMGVITFVWLFRKQDIWGQALCIIGLTAFVIKAVLIYPIQYVGHADASGYAEMAHSLIQRRGLEVDYISWYFRAYDASILRPEDHWPPLYSFLIAPFFLSLGRTAFAAKLPSLILSSIFFPLVGYSFGKHVTRSVSVGFAVGLHLLLLPEMFRNSLPCLSDVPFAFMVFLTVWLCIRGFDKPNLFLWMGISAALAYYAKGSGILLIPIYALFYLFYASIYKPDPVAFTPTPWLQGKRLTGIVLVGMALTFLYDPIWAGPLFLPGFLLLYLLGRWYENQQIGWIHRWFSRFTRHSSRIRRAVSRIILSPRDRTFICGLALGLLLLLPWFIRNTIHFGSPTYSTQQHASGYIGYKGWEEGTYALYWGENVPSFLDKLKDWDTFVESTRNYYKTYLWWIFAHAGKSWGDFNESERSTYVVGVAAIGTLVLLWIAGYYRLFTWYIGRWPRRVWQRLPAGDQFSGSLQFINRWISQVLRPWDEGRFHLLWMVGGILITFLAIFWNPINRLQLPLTSMMILLGWYGYYQVFRLFCLGLTTLAKRALPFRISPPVLSRHLASILLILIWFPLMQYQADTIFTTWKKGAGYPFRESSQNWMDAGRWIHENLPGSITMTRNPWELHFYSQELAIQIPLAPLKEIIATAKYYGATHLIPEARRPALKPWIQGKIPGLELIYNNGLEIYAIRYDQLPPDLRDVPPLDVLRRNDPMKRQGNSG